MSHANKKPGYVIHALNNRINHFCGLHHINALAFKVIVPILFILFIGSISTNIILFNLARNVSSTTTDLGFKNVGELSTQAGYYTNVQVIDKSQTLWGWNIPLTQSKSIFSYDGIIKAGYDFSKIQIIVDEYDRVVTVKLPEPIIFSNEIDPNSLRIFDERQSIFTPLRLDDMNDSLVLLRTESEEKAIQNGLMENTQSNAELLIKGFLSKTYDLTQYEIVFE